MSEEVSIHLEDSENYEAERRDFLNSIFSLLKLLSLYDIENESLIRPREMFEKALFAVRRHSYAKTGIELKNDEGHLTRSKNFESLLYR